MYFSTMLTLILCSIVFLAYFCTPLWSHTGVIFVILALFTKFGSVSGFVMTLSWLLFLAIIIPLHKPAVRRKWVSDQIFRIFQKVMPTISKTEQEALDAGTVWWDADLFSGHPKWNKLLDLPKPGLTENEQDFIAGTVGELCAMLDDWKITNEIDDLPENVWQFLKDKRFFGMIIPKRYGGLEFSALGHSDIIMKIASRSISAAVNIMVPNSLGPAKLLLDYGTEEQKDYYLPRLATGEEIPCFALTGPEAGSDAGSIPDTGIICKGDYKDEKDILGIRLNWDKRYITLGPTATLLGLAFKLFDPDHLLGDKEKLGITLALIPTDIPGVTIGNRHFPLNSAFQVGPNSGKDVFVPITQIIGGSKRVGQGWRMLMDCLAEGRSISLPALSTGSGKLASRAVGAYARIRRQFKMHIGRFEGIEEALARIAGNTYILDSARKITAAAVDAGEKPSVISAIVKYNLTELSRKVINDAMDVQGGAAICMGPRNLIGRVYQSLPISITVEGANILTRSLIIFGQGAIRCHPFLIKEIKAIADPDKENGAIEFDRALFGHIGFTISNAVRTLLLGLTSARIATTPSQGPSARYFQHLSRMSAAFSLLSDVSLLVLGGTLKRKEMLSGRLADVLSHLYLASTVLKRFKDDGGHKEDIPLLKWACEESLYNVQKGMEELLDNFPNRLIAFKLRFLIFPFGRSFTRPDDKLTHQVAQLILSPSPTRDRLTSHIHVPSDTNEPLGRLEDALQKVVIAEEIEKKISKALRDGIFKSKNPDELLKEAQEAEVINQEEADQIIAANDARSDVIAVDDFPLTQWKREG